MSVSSEILLIVAIIYNSILHYQRDKREKMHQERVEELLAQSDEKKKIIEIEMNAPYQAELNAYWRARKKEEEEEDDKK